MRDIARMRRGRKVRRGGRSERRARFVPPGKSIVHPGRPAKSLLHTRGRAVCTRARRGRPPFARTGSGARQDGRGQDGDIFSAVTAKRSLAGARDRAQCMTGKSERRRPLTKILAQAGRIDGRLRRLRLSFNLRFTRTSLCLLKNPSWLQGTVRDEAGDQRRAARRQTSARAEKRTLRRTRDTAFAAAADRGGAGAGGAGIKKEKTFERRPPPNAGLVARSDDWSGLLEPVWSGSV